MPVPIIHRISKVAKVTPLPGELRYEATNVGTSIQKVFASLPPTKQERQAVNICNTHATQSIYITWVPEGHATLVGGSDLTAAKCKEICPALESRQLQLADGIDIYVLGSGATTTYTAEELA
jgi:hypothetical protein